jgi:hypothetical protein
MKFENKKWVLRVALAGALSLGVATEAKADSRLDGMGADVRQVDDVDGIWLYPNQILQYKNTVDFRLNPTGYGSNVSNTAGNAVVNANGVGVNEWGGVIHDLGDDFGTIATYVNRPSAIGNVAGTLVAFGGKITPIFAEDAALVGGATNKYAPSSNVDVFWGHTNFLGLGDAGIHLSYGDNETTANGAGPNVQSQVWGIGFGLNLGSFIGLASQAHIDYTEDFLTLNRPAAPGINTPLTDNGVYTFKIGYLGQGTLNDKDNLRLFADVQYDNNSLPTGWSALSGQQAANDLEVLVGSSIKHNITDKGFVNTGLEFEYDSANSTTNTAADSWTLLWNANVESSLSSWLTARAGLEKAIVNRTYVSTPPGSTYTDNSLVAGLNNNVAHHWLKRHC